MDGTQHIIHTIDPVYNADSRVLILGTMPSPQSRLAAFYYGNRQNRFWTILGAVFKENIGPSIAAKKQFLLKRHIALWDVLAECDITGASDASIRNPAANDFGAIFAAAKIRAVLTTGKMAYNLYARLCSAKYNAPFYYLPSPSPANRAMSLEQITAPYKTLLPRFCGEQRGGLLLTEPANPQYFLQAEISECGENPQRSRHRNRG